MVLTLAAAAAWLAAIVSQAHVVLTWGRGSYDLGYDDVVYALVGKRAVIDFGTQGFLSTVGGWLAGPPHAPFIEALSIVTQSIFGTQQDVLYSALAVLLGVASIVFASALASTWLMRFAVAAVLAASPLGFLMVNEFRPDVFYVLIAMGAIAHAARAALRPSGSSSNTRFVYPVCLGIALLFVKPTWIVLTTGTFIGLLATIVVFSVGASAHIDGRGRAFARILWCAVRLPLLLVLVASAVWGLWLGPSIYEYLTTVMSYFIAASPEDALRQTYDPTMVYVGDAAAPLVYVAFGTSFVLAAFLLVRCRLGSRAVRDVVLLSTPLLGIAIAVFATAASQIPSPFQGLYIFGVLVAFAWSLLAYFAIRSRSVLQPRARVPATVVGGLLLIGVTGALIWHGQPVRDRPALFAPPLRAETRVAQAIGSACQSPGGATVTVLVAPIEDMNHEGVTYYLPLPSAAGPTFSVTSPPPLTTSPSHFVGLARQYDVVVTRPTDYAANGIPSNVLLQDLDAALRHDPSYRQLPTGLPEGSYDVFAKRTVCGSG